MTEPSEEAMWEIAEVIEKVMLSPGDDPKGFMVLSLATASDGEAMIRVMTAPKDAADVLHACMREHLEGDGRGLSDAR